jgi:hypothetical protein
MPSLRITRRRSFLLFALFDTLALPAKAQQAQSEVSETLGEIIQGIVSEFKLSYPVEIPNFFVELLKARLRLSLSELSSDAETEIRRFVEARQRQVFEGEAEKLAAPAVKNIVVNTVRIQNLATASGTQRDGRVLMSSELIDAASKLLCLWPYC